MHERRPLVPPTILVVEDSPDDAMIVGLTFQETGIGNPITILEDGEQAIDYLCGRRQYADRGHHPLPLLLILDLNLPRFNGFQVLEACRGVLETESIPVIVLSVSDHPTDKAKALAKGANKVIRKPIDPAMLLQVVSEVSELGLLLVRSQ